MSFTAGEILNGRESFYFEWLVSFQFGDIILSDEAQILSTEPNSTANVQKKGAVARTRNSLYFWEIWYFRRNELEMDVIETQLSIKIISKCPNKTFKVQKQGMSESAGDGENGRDILNNYWFFTIFNVTNAQ